MNQTPKVSIIMATYNRAHFIVETLESIQQQTCKDWECLIIDDGGNDKTQDVIKDLLEIDSRFQFFKRPDKYAKGLPGSRNYGLDLAKGDYIIFFDDDDFVHPDNLKISIKAITANDFAYCHFQKQSYVTQKPKIQKAVIKTESVLSIKDIARVIRQEIGLASCTVMWKKECFKQIRFQETLLYAEEWECYSRIISEGFIGVVIDTVLYFNRKHPDSNTGEFYKNNPVRRESKKKAIVLVVKNLNNKKLLTGSLLHYFIQISLNFKEYNLFDDIINNSGFSKILKLKWRLFYFILPFRLRLYSMYKKIKKNN